MKTDCLELYDDDNLKEFISAIFPQSYLEALIREVDKFNYKNRDKINMTTRPFDETKHRVAKYLL